MKSFSIKITSKANTDLDELWNSIAKHSLDSAEKLLLRIDYRIRSLAQFPETGVPRFEIYENLRLLIEGSYVILYMTRDGMIIILRVVHGARDLTRLKLF
jgi:toxin ParE1/3/4